MNELLSYYQQAQLSEPLELASILTMLSLIPLAFIAMTCFTRFIIVLSLLRFALGLQQTPPNMVLVTIGFFLTLFAMEGTFKQIHNEGLAPYLAEQITLPQAVEQGKAPLKAFMLKQTREEDLLLLIQVGKFERPKNADEVAFSYLIPAFMLSELKTAFKIGFIIFIPFLLVDLIVASVLMSLGMIMLPPITISLPIKIMLFVVMDGWALLTQSLLSGVG